MSCWWSLVTHHRSLVTLASAQEHVVTVARCNSHSIISDRITSNGVDANLFSREQGTSLPRRLLPICILLLLLAQPRFQACQASLGRWSNRELSSHKVLPRIALLMVLSDRWPISNRMRAVAIFEAKSISLPDAYRVPIKVSARSTLAASPIKCHAFQ